MDVESSDGGIECVRFCCKVGHFNTEAPSGDSRNCMFQHFLDPDVRPRLELQNCTRTKTEELVSGETVSISLQENARCVCFVDRTVCLSLMI